MFHPLVDADILGAEYELSETQIYLHVLKQAAHRSSKESGVAGLSCSLSVFFTQCKCRGTCMKTTEEQMC